MEYKVCLESEKNDFPPEEWYTLVSDDLMLDWNLKKYLEHLYHECDGWEWMPRSNKKLIVMGENGKTQKFSFTLDFEPTFYVGEVKDGH